MLPKEAVLTFMMLFGASELHVSINGRSSILTGWLTGTDHLFSLSHAIVTAASGMSVYGGVNTTISKITLRCPFGLRDNKSCT